MHSVSLLCMLRNLPVVCGSIVQPASVPVRVNVTAGKGYMSRTHRPRISQRCSIGNGSGDKIGQSRVVT